MIQKSRKIKNSSGAGYRFDPQIFGPRVLRQGVRPDLSKYHFDPLIYDPHPELFLIGYIASPSRGLPDPGSGSFEQVG
jgi:hypothetical protein